MCPQAYHICMHKSGSNLSFVKNGSWAIVDAHSCFDYYFEYFVI